nr:retrovirus-related Pol polyprotein from transposon TNT 1-94 [Tanacetum cinerariifolium]
MFRGDKIEVKGTMQGAQLAHSKKLHSTKATIEFRILQRQDAAMQAQENGVVFDEEQLLFIVDGQANTFDDDVEKALVQDLALNEDNVFQDDQCDAFNYDVDEAPTAQTLFMANLSSADLVYDKANSSYDLVILSEYVKDNAVPVVQSNVSSVPNDALMMIINDMHEQAPNVSLRMSRANIMNDVNNVSRFFELHDAYTIERARCLELEAEISELRHKIEKDDHGEMIKLFSNLEIDHLNLQLKYQNLKEYFRNNKSQPSQDAPEFDKKFVINKMKASLHGKDNAIRKLKEQISQMNKAETEKVKQHYKELYDYIKIMRAKTIGKTTSLFTKNEKLKAQLNGKRIYVTMLVVKPKVLAPGCSKHMTGNRSRLRNFVKRFIVTVRFENDDFSAITGYGDYMIGDSVISKVYYVEGLRDNLFSIGQFCDSDLEIAFRKHSCYVIDIDSVELLEGSRGSYLYTISVEDMMRSSPICLLSKASKNKSWLWHHWLNHLNFDTINDLTRKYLVRGLPRLKFEKDHLCYACQLGKSKKYTHKSKSKNTIMEVLHTLHMDLCGPMRVQSINGKKYILVIVDDYLGFTWVKFLRSKNETSEFVIKFLKQIQVGLSKTVRYIQTDHEDVATACYTQNRSLIHTHHNKTPYELVHDKKPNLKFLRVFGLVPDPVRAAPYVTPTNKDLDILIQPMFDKYLEPPNVERPIPPALAIQVLVVLTGTPSFTTIDQDAPSISYSSSSLEIEPPISHQGVILGPTIKDNPFLMLKTIPL